MLLTQYCLCTAIEPEHLLLLQFMLIYLFDILFTFVGIPFNYVKPCPIITPGAPFTNMV